MARIYSRVAIIGGNFAGLTAAMQFSEKRYQITLFDVGADFEWTPNIHEIISGVKAPEGLRLSRKKLMKKAGHQFIQERVLRLDPRHKSLHTETGREVLFDTAIVAVGGADLHHRIPGAEKFAIPFSTADHCAQISTRLAELSNREKFSVAIVGANVTGIEALGEVLRKYRDHPGLAVHVIEAGSRILPTAPRAVGEDIRMHADAYNVRFHTDRRVERIAEKSVRLSNSARLPADLVLWCAGSGTPQLLRDAGLADDTGAWAPARITLQSTGFDHMFLAGDCTDVPGPARKQSYHAIEMGQLAAANLKRWVRGRRLKSFKPSKKPILVAFGDIETYLVAGERAIASPSLAAAKEGIFQGGMALFAPPLDKSGARQVYDRFEGSVRKMILPQIASLERAKQLGKYRIIS